MSWRSQGFQKKMALMRMWKTSLKERQHSENHHNLFDTNTVPEKQLIIQLTPHTGPLKLFPNEKCSLLYQSLPQLLLRLHQYLHPLHQQRSHLANLKEYHVHHPLVRFLLDPRFLLTLTHTPHQKSSRNHYQKQWACHQRTPCLLHLLERKERRSRRRWNKGVSQLLYQVTVYLLIHLSYRMVRVAWLSKPRLPSQVAQVVLRVLHQEQLDIIVSFTIIICVIYWIHFFIYYISSCVYHYYNVIFSASNWLRYTWQDYCCCGKTLNPKAQFFLCILFWQE